MKQRWIYGLGVFFLGLSYYWLKSALKAPWFFIVALSYLIVLSLVAQKYGR